MFLVFFGTFRNTQLREPSFQNKPLGQWLWEYSQTQSNRVAAAAAVHAIGTNALPFLVAELKQTEDPALGRAKRRAEEHLRMRIISGADRASLALAGFEILGTNAVHVVPDLIKLFHDADPYLGGHHPAYQATRAVKQIGAATVPALISATTNANEMTRLHACFALSELGAKDAVPALIARLNDSSRMVRIRAALALGSLRANHENVVPQLAQALLDSDSAVRFSAASALGKFGPEAAPILSSLHQALAREIKRPPGKLSTGAVFQEKASSEVIAAIRNAITQSGSTSNGDF